jgi:hypothetical protein
MKINCVRVVPALACSVIIGGLATAADFEADTLDVPTSSLLSAELMKGEHYTIDDTVTVKGYMNHYTVRSDYGEFTAVGDRALRKLIGETIAIGQLKEMDSLSVGTDAAIGAVTDTANSLVALATDPVGSVNNLSAGVSRFFKRTSKTVGDVSEKAKEEATDAVNGEEDEEGGEASTGEPDVTTQLASSYLGIGKAQRQMAKELEVDPYSYNEVLQAELSRVAKVSGSVGKVTSLLIPIPSVIGTAAGVSDMVWNLSPTDLLIQNQEKLTAMGFDPMLIERFFESKLYSPTEQTVMVASIESLDGAANREILLETALLAETKIEGDYFLRSAEFYARYDQKIGGITRIIDGNRLPIAITEAGDGLIFAALDHLLWSEEVAAGVAELDQLMDTNSSSGKSQIWIEGMVSEMATAKLSESGWQFESQGMEKVQ